MSELGTWNWNSSGGGQSSSSLSAEKTKTTQTRRKKRTRRVNMKITLQQQIGSGFISHRDKLTKKKAASVAVSFSLLVVNSEAAAKISRPIPLQNTSFSFSFYAFLSQSHEPLQFFFFCNYYWGYGEYACENACVLYFIRAGSHHCLPLSGGANEAHQARLAIAHITSVREGKERRRRRKRRRRRVRASREESSRGSVFASIG